MKDAYIGGILLIAAIFFLMQRNLSYLSVWLLMITIILAYGTRMKYTAAVVFAILIVLAVIWISGQRIREGMDVKEKDGEEKSEKEEEEPEPHMDKAETMLNAFNGLSPKQVAAMRDDTKELMETQQQLMQTLSSLGPQVQQGAELIKSFQGMFGGNLLDVLKPQQPKA
jgi:hypothetical protein